MILNLTQHDSTLEQIEQGVFNPSQEDKNSIISLLTVDEIPNNHEVINICTQIASIALKYKIHNEPLKSMIGGAPAMMSFLEEELKKVDIEHVYAFSKRVSLDEIQKDGSIKKTTVVKHIGWGYSHNN